MIPPFDSVTGNLPPGVHEATWNDVVALYGYSVHRLMLLAGLKAALDALRLAGCRRVYIDGSFVTAKERPNDFDACWEAEGVDPGLLDPVLLTWANRRAAQKEKYRGELFIANGVATPSGVRYIEFFQLDRSTGARKGIIAIDLGALP